MINFERIKTGLQKRAVGHNDSEIKHIVSFLEDVIDNVTYDVETGNYVGREKEALKAQLLGSLDELRVSCDLLETDVKKLLK